MKRILLFLFLATVLCTSHSQNKSQAILQIEKDHFPYEESLAIANRNKDKVLAGTVFLARGLYYEDQGKRREAIKEYGKAYDVDTVMFLSAKERIDSIRNSMNDEHKQLLTNIEVEEAKSGAILGAVLFGMVAAVEVAAAYQNADNVNTGTVAPINTTSYQSNSTAQVYNPTENTINSAPTAKNKTVCPVCGGKKICTTVHSTYYKEYCQGSTKCSNCNGSGLMNYIFGAGEIKCSYCDESLTPNKGNGVCHKCHGTGECSRCNGKGYI